MTPTGVEDGHPSRHGTRHRRRLSGHSTPTCVHKNSKEGKRASPAHRHSTGRQPATRPGQTACGACHPAAQNLQNSEGNISPPTALFSPSGESQCCPLQPHPHPDLTFSGGPVHLCLVLDDGRAKSLERDHHGCPEFRDGVVASPGHQKALQHPPGRFNTVQHRAVWREIPKQHPLRCPDWRLGPNRLTLMKRRIVQDHYGQPCFPQTAVVSSLTSRCSP